MNLIITRSTRAGVKQMAAVWCGILALALAPTLADAAAALSQVLLLPPYDSLGLPAEIHSKNSS